MADELTAKLESWVQTHPESADTPFMNVSTGQEFTVRGLLRSLQAREAGAESIDEELAAELRQVEEWIGGVRNA